MRIFTGIRSGHRFTMMPRRIGKSEMTKVWRRLTFNHKRPLEKIDIILEEFDQLFKVNVEADEIRKEVINEEERFKRLLDGTENEFLKIAYDKLYKLRKCQQ